MPGSWMSIVYRAAPLAFSNPSLRRTPRLPMTLYCSSGYGSADQVIEGLQHPLLLIYFLRLVTHGRHPLPRSCRLPRPRRPARSAGRPCPADSGRLGYRLDVRGIRAAAAQVADHGLLDLVHCRVGVAVQQRLGRDHEARRAEAALHAAVLDVGVDERVVRPGDPLDGLDALSAHSMASIMQESTGRPSIMTVHAPQAPSAQNSLVPVSPSFSSTRTAGSTAARP